MGDCAILSHVTPEGSLIEVSSLLSGPTLLRAEVHKLVDSLVPGDRLDLDNIPENLKVEFLDEFEGRNYFLSSEGIVGMIDECPVCEGTSMYQGKDCSHCEGFCLMVSEGQGWVPYRK